MATLRRLDGFAIYRVLGSLGCLAIYVLSILSSLAIYVLRSPGGLAIGGVPVRGKA